MRRPYVFLTGLTLAIAMGFIGFRLFWPKTPDPRVLAEEEMDLGVSYSNILPADYVGPQTCKECHATQYGRWKRHPHSRMNQMADQKSVVGDFDDVCVRFPTGEAHFSTEGEKFFMDVLKNGQLHRKYEVTRTVGSRYMQFYVGKQLQGPDPAGDPIYGEHMLPFSWWFKLKRWLPRQYFDNDGDEVLKNGVPQVEAIDRRPHVRQYTQVCMNCHNTFAYSFRIFNPEYVGFPDATVAGALKPLSDALASTLKIEPTVDSFASANVRLDPERHLVSLGISCESCHFGGREHAVHEKKIRFLPTSKFIKVKQHYPDFKPMTASRRNPTTVLGICTQCHSGNGKMYPNGAGKSNSREALDMHAGFCTTKLRCVSCHDPHQPSDGPSGGPDNPRHLALCIKCHDQYAEPEAAAAHGKHPPGSKVNCLDCHMPRYTQGLDELIRTHRICNPVEEVMVKAGSANACNVCHLDKSLGWTLTELDKGWGKKIKPKTSWPSYPDLDRPTGELWLNGKDNQLRLVAAQCYARSPLGKKMFPELVRALNDPEPLNRTFTSCAVKKVLGKQPHERLAIDITDSPARRQAQIERFLREYR